jgi:hypothetical protein
MKLLLSVLLLLLLLSYNKSTVNVSAQQTNVDVEVDFDVCYFELDQEERSGNGILDIDEYFEFAKDFGGRTECLGNLTFLPLDLRLVWNQLSCECTVRGGDDECCLGNNANIPVAGSDNFKEASVKEQQYLRQVCLRTDQAIIAYCGPPPAATIPPLPPVVSRGLPDSDPDDGLSVAAIAGIIAGTIILLLLCCNRRRMWLCGGRKVEEDSSESSSSSDDDSSDSGESREDHVTRQVDIEMPDDADPPVEEEGLESAGALAAVPALMDADDEDAAKKRGAGEEEEEDDGQAIWNRTVQDADYEDETDPYKRGPIALEASPDDADQGMNLRHVEKPPPETPPEDPYELEHYVPDGGIVEHERNWEGGYDADGGWTPEEREGKSPSEPHRQKYQREVKEEAEPVDTRKQRTIEALGAGEVFDQLDGGEPEGSVAPDDMFDWVIRSTLNTLDQKGDQLKGSDHGSDDEDRV